MDNNLYLDKLIYLRDTYIKEAKLYAEMGNKCIEDKLKVRLYIKSYEYSGIADGINKALKLYNDLNTQINS